MAENRPSKALFPPVSNTIARLILGTVGALAIGGLGLLLLYFRSPLFTNQYESVAQPVQFDHRHHVRDNGMDCRYCHSTVEKGASAGLPPTETCGSCHNQVWNKSPYLAPVRKSFFTDTPLQWKRVHDLNDYVYFNHSIHIAKGVGCVTCHGRVDEMAETVKWQPMTMQWCLDCHKNPTPNLRPREFITSMTWQAEDPIKTGEEIAKLNNVHTRVACSTCHR